MHGLIVEARSVGQTHSKIS